MISIRWRLTVLLCVALGGLFIATGIGVFVSMGQLLGSRFDETLTAKARALITASEIDDDEFEIDMTIQDFAGFGTGGNDYFQVRRLGGELFQSSPSLAMVNTDHWGLDEIQAPADDEPRISDGMLGEDNPARIYVQRFYPKDDHQNEYKDLYLLVASPSGSINSQLTVLAVVLAVAGGAGLLLMVPLVRLGLDKGLRPLDRLAVDVGKIRPENLHQRLDEKALPDELVPVAARLNEWLARLEESFEREKRFSSHAAHELRTPLAELKSMTEMGSLWSEETGPEHYAEMLAVVCEMESTLDKLSMLARADAGSQTVNRVRIELRASISTVVERLGAVVEERGLRLELDVSDETLVTDPVLWGILVQNLIGNAVDYAPEGSVIVVKASAEGLEVRNPAPDLTEEDRRHLFDRFWRKDTSRNEEQNHSGLGLSIVQACAKLLGAECYARVGEADELVMVLKFVEQGSPID